MIKRAANAWIIEQISPDNPNQIITIVYSDNENLYYHQECSLCELLTDNFPRHMRSKTCGGIVLKIENKGWEKGIPLADTLEKIEY